MQHGRPWFDWFGCYQVATVRFVVWKLVCKHLPSGSETEKFNTNRRSRLPEVEVKVVSFMQITNNPDKIMMTIRFLVQQPPAATCQLGLCRTMLIINCGKSETFFNQKKKPSWPSKCTWSGEFPVNQKKKKKKKDLQHNQSQEGCFHPCVLQCAAGH